MKKALLLQRLGTVLNFCSSFWIIFLYAYYFFCAMKIGWFPQFSYPDPKEIISSHDKIELLLLYSLVVYYIFSGLFNLALFIGGLIMRKRLINYSLIVFIINALIYLNIDSLDFFGILNWFLD